MTSISTEVKGFGTSFERTHDLLVSRVNALLLQQGHISLPKSSGAGVHNQVCFWNLDEAQLEACRQVVLQVNRELAGTSEYPWELWHGPWNDTRPISLDISLERKENEKRA